LTTERLNCVNCGAALDVPPAAHFVTCNPCGTQFTVHRSSCGSFTEASTGTTLHDLADRIAELTRENELLRLDYDWNLEKEKYIFKGGFGQRMQPTVAWSVVNCIFAVAFTIMMAFFAPTVVALLGGAVTFWQLAGALSGCIGIGGSIYCYIVAKRYDKAHEAYLQRRDELLDGTRWSLRRSHYP
jgi:hypothetical protein